MMIWVLHISHKHGDSYWAKSLESQARSELAAFARGWWESEGVPGEPPAGDEEATSLYFTHVSDYESWHIESVPLSS